MTPVTDASLFIGSSVEGLDVAFALQEGLEFDAEATVWSQGIFTPSQPTLSNLLAALDSFQFAAFVFTPDDLLTLRGAQNTAVRDNVLFEFGLFVGKIGLERCFYVMPSKADEFRLPTDLVGTTPLTYKAGRKDGNLVAALGPACNKIRRVLRTRRPGGELLERLLASWEGTDVSGARARLRHGIDSDPRGHDADDRKAIQRSSHCWKAWLTESFPAVCRKRPQSRHSGSLYSLSGRLPRRGFHRPITWMSGGNHHHGSRYFTNGGKRAAADVGTTHTPTSRRRLPFRRAQHLSLPA